MENCCRKVSFSNTELVWRTVEGRYCFVMLSKCGELLQEILFSVTEPVFSTVEARYCFLIWSQCGELLQEVIGL